MNYDFFVSGMTCDACCRLISLQVKRLPGVKDVTVSRDKGTLSIVSDGEITRDAVQTSLKNTSYQITQ